MNKQCDEYEFLITLYIDGESEEADKRRVFLHLAECESCRSYWGTATEMKLQAAREKRLVAPVRLDRRLNSTMMPRASSLKRVGTLRALFQRRIFVPAPVAVLLALFILVGGAGFAVLWSSKPQPAKEVVEPIVYVKLPTVEVEGRVHQQESTVR